MAQAGAVDGALGSGSSRARVCGSRDIEPSSILWKASYLASKNPNCAGNGRKQGGRGARDARECSVVPVILAVLQAARSTEL